MLTLICRLVLVLVTGPVAAQPAMQPAAQRATQPAANITPIAHVEMRGNGPVTMILVPGLDCDWTVYDAFMTRNASKYTMYAVTLPGFGGSEPPPKDTDWLDNAERAVVQLVHEKKLDHPIVVGHSLGGNLAIRLSIHHPEDFRAAISIDGLPVFPPPQPGQPDTPEARKAMAQRLSDMFAKMTDEQFAAGGKQSMANLVTDPKRAAELAEMASVVPRDTMVHYMSELICSDLRGEMKEVKIPLMVIAAISLEMGKDAADRIHEVLLAEFKYASPDVHMEFLYGSRHFVMDDKPEALDKFVADFVGSLKDK